MSKIYGYARVSTQKQSIERQIRNIRKECPDADIRQEVYTGTKTEGRAEWRKLMKRVQPGDTIIFDSVSRMSRNAEEGFAQYQELYNQGINLIFLKEPHINTATYKKVLENRLEMTGDKIDYILEGINQYLMALAKEQIRLAFEQAQKEVDDLRQRTKEGLQTARMAGKHIGMPEGKKVTTKKSIAAKADIMKYSKDFGGTLNDADCMKICGISHCTYYKYKKELKA